MDFSMLITAHLAGNPRYWSSQSPTSYDLAEQRSGRPLFRAALAVALIAIAIIGLSWFAAAGTVPESASAIARS